MATARILSAHPRPRAPSVELLGRVVPRAVTALAMITVRLALLAMPAVISVVPGMPPPKHNRSIFSCAVENPEPHDRAQRDANVLVRRAHVRRVEICTIGEESVRAESDSGRSPGGLGGTLRRRTRRRHDPSPSAASRGPTELLPRKHRRQRSDMKLTPKLSARLMPFPCMVSSGAQQPCPAHGASVGMQ